MAKDNLFFNLNNPHQGLQRELGPSLTTRIFSGDQGMLSIVEVAPNAAGTRHSHPQEQWGVLLKGSGFRRHGDKEIPVKKGDFWRTPGGLDHGFRAGPEGATILDIFSPPREEYKKAGSGLGSGATGLGVCRSTSQTHISTPTCGLPIDV
jgi:quercetin dioxygenase-like cupin family protein